MVCGCLPFDEPDMDVLYDRIIAGDYDFSPAPRLSPDVRHLIRGLLHMPPEQRLTARQVMGHRWMRAVAAPPSLAKCHRKMRVRLLAYKPWATTRCSRRSATARSAR